MLLQRQIPDVVIRMEIRTPYQRLPYLIIARSTAVRLLTRLQAITGMEILVTVATTTEMTGPEMLAIQVPCRIKPRITRIHQCNTVIHRPRLPVETIQFSTNIRMGTIMDLSRLSLTTLVGRHHEGAGAIYLGIPRTC